MVIRNKGELLVVGEVELRKISQPSVVERNPCIRIVKNLKLIGPALRVIRPGNIVREWDSTNGVGIGIESEADAVILVVGRRKARNDAHAIKLGDRTGI